MTNTKDDLEKLCSKQQEQINLLTDRLATEQQAIKGMKAIYSAIFLVDVRTGESRELLTHSNLPEFISNVEDSDIIQKEYIDIVLPQYQQAYKEFFDWSTIDERMREKESLVIEFQDKLIGWIRTRLVQVSTDDNGRITQVMVASEEINAEREQYDMLVFNSEHDSLTGIRNRFSGERIFSQMIEDNQSGIFMLFDVDHFKTINDTYGHYAGDQLLVAFTRLLSDSFHNSVCIRLGGDEFAVIMACDYNRGDLSRQIQNFYQAINRLRVPEIGNEHFSVSIGGTIFNDEGTMTTFDEVYRETDHRLYNSKKYEGNFLTLSDYVVPDLEHTFQSLLNDRLNYNRSNESLYRIRDQKSWIKFMEHNDAINIDLCNKHQQYLDKVFECFQAADVPDIDYDILYEMVFNYRYALDPFLNEVFLGEILLPHYRQRKNQNRSVLGRLAYLYLMLGDSMLEIYQMTDHSMLKNATTLLNRCLEVSKNIPVDSADGEYQIFAIAKLINTCNHSDEGAISPDEATQLYQRYRQLIDDNRLQRLHNKKLYEYFALPVHFAILYPLLRARYLDKIPELTIEQTNERAMIKLYLQAHSFGDTFDMPSTIPFSEPHVHLLMRLVNKTLPSNLLLEYLRTNASMLNKEKVTGLEFALYSYLLNEALAILREKSFSEIERQTHVRSMWAYTEHLFSKRDATVTNDFLGMFLDIVLSDPLLRRYLTTEEKVHFLTKVVSSTMIYTTGHAIAVAKIAQVICDCVIQERPDLLLGLFGYTTIYEIRFNKQHIFDFLRMGCLLHDIGKSRMRNVVRNSFRNLTEHEYDMLQSHPEVGAEMLTLDPSLNAVRDLVLGHHKWYNGEGGYPQSFDNTRSDVRILIDILSMADCLEAVTSRMGRGYRKPKSFGRVMSEFREGAGTHYNPELVFMIFRSANAYEILERLVERDWENTYLDIYKSFVNDKKTYDIKTSNLA